MSDITLGYIFVPAEGTNRLTAQKLNRMGNGAVINPSFISSKPAVSGPSSGDQLLMLKADGTYARVPATAFGGGGGGGDMFKSVYDTNANGVVDNSEAVPWTGVTGKPATFPPDATAMLKSVYDANANGVVDTCDNLAWAKLTGVPTSFTPSAHASTHLSAGSDPIALATSVLAGLCPAVDNTTIQVVASKLSTVALAWTAITGKPSTFTPGAHASTHQSGGSDSIALDTLAVPTDITTLNAATTAHGLLPKLSGTVTQYLTGSGTWVAVPYSSLTGTPSTFSPSAHATTHLDNGTDPVPVATTVRTGSLRILSGTATQYLDGTGAWSTPAPAGTVNPGTYTAFTYQANWSENSTARYRVETNGTFQKIVFKGSIKKAATFTTNLAAILPAGARPSDTRRFSLSGQETNTSPDECLYTGVIDTAGNFNIYPVVRASFVWQTFSNLQTIWLDGVSLEL